MPNPRFFQPHSATPEHPRQPDHSFIRVTALPLWLKSDRFMEWHPSPAEARKFAISLLQAAENVERVNAEMDARRNA